MVIALFALSLVMIVGGIAAVVQGFPYVRLESGLAMVIGGTTAASAGVVLLGLGAAVMQLKRLAALFDARRGDGSDTDAREGARPFALTQRGPAPPLGTLSAPELAGGADLAGATLGALTTAGQREDRRAEGNALREQQEPLLPDLLPPEEPTQVGPDEDLFVHPEDRRGHVAQSTTDTVAERTEANAQPRNAGEEELVLRPALSDVVTSTSVEPGSPGVSNAVAPESASQTAERHAVGSYASGGNTYVMYSDGTIDADTPRGRFTFQSLDELKEFVASGEAGERGAA